MTKINLEKCKSSNKGITLIALIITIIVLLILAGVTISQITGNESAMEKATEAREKNEQGTELEAIKLATVNAVASDLTGLVNVDILKDELNGIVEDEGRLAINKNNSPWQVIGKTGKTYEISQNGNVEVITGVILSTKNLTLEIKNDTYGEDTITARLVDIAGTLTWTSSSDIIDIISSVDGMSATIKAVSSGNAKITVECSTGDKAECNVTIIKEEIPQIGDSIEYSISYQDMFNSSNYYTSSTGWKILSAGKYNSTTQKYDDITIISTGIPANLRLKCSEKNGNLWWDTTKNNIGEQVASGLRNENLFFNILFDGDLSNTNKGWNKGKYESITNNEALNTNTCEIFKTSLSSNVHNLTLEELNTAINIIEQKNVGDSGYREPSTNIYSVTNEMFKLSNSHYCLANAKNGSELMYVGSDGAIYGSSGGTYGLRPVILLKSVNLEKDNNVWKIKTNN